MFDKENPGAGKTRLDVASYAADLSGRDFDGVCLDRSQTLSHSFLNGSSFKNSTFLGGPIDQTELAEAQIIDCFFDETDFTGSSFIGATVDGTTFRKCVFADGEWRKSRFTNVVFQDCNFNYTTVNLCVFDNCEFYGKDSKHLDNRSVNYNVFTQCYFDVLYADEVVLAKNFGLPGTGKSKSLSKYRSSISLEEVCIQSSSSRTVVSELIAAIENEFKTENVHRLKTMRLEFISNIVGALTRSKKMSATTLVYLETFFSRLAKAGLSEADVLAAMSVVLSLRSLLFDYAQESPPNLGNAHYHCQEIDIEYERTYTNSDAVELAKILGELTTGDPNTFMISRVAYGSTFIELIALQVVSVGAVLTALNFALRQANTALVQAQEIRKNARKLVKSAPKVSKKRGKKNVSRMQALQQPASPTKDATLLREAVAMHGYQAVLLDDEAKVTVHYISSK